MKRTILELLELEDRTAAAVDVFFAADAPPNTEFVRFAHVDTTNEWKVAAMVTTGNTKQAVLYDLDPASHSVSNGIVMAEGPVIYIGEFSPDGRYLPVTAQIVGSEGTGRGMVFDSTNGSMVMQGNLILDPADPYRELIFEEVSNNVIAPGTGNGGRFTTFTVSTGQTFALSMPEDTGIGRATNQDATRLAGVAVVDGLIEPWYGDLIGANAYNVTFVSTPSGLGGAIEGLSPNGTHAGGFSGAFFEEVAAVLDVATVYNIPAGNGFQVTYASNELVHGAFHQIMDTGLYGGSGVFGTFVYEYISASNHWTHALTFEDYLATEGGTWTHNEDRLHDLEQTDTTTAWLVGVGSQSYFVFIDNVQPDISPPDTSIVTGPPGFSNSTSASFTFSGTDNVTPAAALTFECRVDGGSWVQNGNTLTLTGLANGSHTMEVRAKDAAGNVDGTPTLFGWTVDTIAPTASFGSASAALARMGPVTYTVSLNDVNLNSASVSLSDFRLVATGSAGGTLALSGNTLTVSNIVGDGSLAVELLAGSVVDLAGNTNGAKVTSGSFAVDNTGPTVGITTPVAASALTASSTFSYIVSYTDPNFGSASLTPAGVTLNRTGSANGIVSVTQLTTSSYRVSISNMTGMGTLSISIAAGTASDLVGNMSSLAGPSSTVTVSLNPVFEVLGTPGNNTGVISLSSLPAHITTVIVRAGAGNDNYTVANDAGRMIDVQFFGEGGDDTLILDGSLRRATITGHMGAGNDNFYVRPGALSGATLATVLASRTYPVSVNGDGGDDFLSAVHALFPVSFNGGLGNNTLLGGVAADLFWAALGSGVNLLDGGNGANRFVLDGGVNTARGGNDRDNFDVNGGVNALLGLGGNDIYDMDGGINLIIDSGSNTIHRRSGFTLQLSSPALELAADIVFRTLRRRTF